MDFWNSLPAILRKTLIGAGLFLAGAALSFGYSYRPLHGAMTWKVDQLEAKLDERNRENLVLGDELAKLRAVEAVRIDPEALESVEEELKKTKRALASAEKKLERGEKKRKDSLARADRWRKRYESLRDEQVAAAATPPTQATDLAASSASPSANGSPPLGSASGSPDTPPAAAEPSVSPSGSPPASGVGILPRNEPQTFP
jgi:hypothetical protein